MKKIITLLCCAVITCSAFSQLAYNCLFLVGSVPYNAADSVVSQILIDDGFTLDIQPLSMTTPTSGYDLVFITETPGSGTAGWANYGPAPMPLVTLKIHALKSTSLAWLSTAVTGTDYDNSLFTWITIEDPTHPMMKGYSDSINIVDDATTSGANCGWGLVPATSGVTTVASLHGDDNRQNIIAVDVGTSLNGLSFANRAIMMAFHAAAAPDFTEDAEEMILRACEWAVTGDVVGISDVATTVETSVYPNPSNGTFKLQFDRMVSDMDINVIAIDGREVLSTQLINGRSIEIDLTSMSSGIYFLKYKGLDITGTLRLLKK